MDKVREALAELVAATDPRGDTPVEGWKSAWRKAREALSSQPAEPVELGDRFMEILRAIHGDMPDDFADSARLAFVHATKVTQPAPSVPADTLRGLDTPTRVRFYEHDFYVLSNFSAFTLNWRNWRFDTSEAAYHYEKFIGGGARADVIARCILCASSAHEAFKIAEYNKALRRPDWDDVKVGIMRDILRAKAAQHEYVRRKLLATGDRELVEDSWRDDFWGWGPNRDGQNMLGKLWMEVRHELREAPHPAAKGGAE